MDPPPPPRTRPPRPGASLSPQGLQMTEGTRVYRMLYWAMRQRILGLHTPPCHKRMVITTLSSMFCLVALQPYDVLGCCIGGGGGGHYTYPDLSRK